MNNIQKPHILVYVGLLLILFVLVVLVSTISLPKSKKSTITPSPTKPVFPLLPTKSGFEGQATITKFPLLTPTGTGASEEIPKNIEDAATQKQNLKNILPLQQADFSIKFDYVTDKFIVTLSEPKNSSKQSFFTWLKNNYPLIPINRFTF